MNKKNNRFTLDFDEETLTIRINGKLVVAYPKSELGRPVLEVFFGRMETVFRHPFEDAESFELMAVGFQIPSRGPCTLCRREANLLGGICYGCSQQAGQKS